MNQLAVPHANIVQEVLPTLGHHVLEVLTFPVLYRTKRLGLAVSLIHHRIGSKNTTLPPPRDNTVESNAVLVMYSDPCRKYYHY